MNKFLTQKFGGKDELKIWMDYDLKKNIKWTPQLEEALQDSAIILIFMSNAYLGSFWCEKEFRNFIHNRKETKSSIFLIGYDEVDDKSIPSELQELQPYNFWKRDNITHLSTTLGLKDLTQDYFDKINNLSIDIAQELKKENETKIIKSDKNVFLAEVTDDLEDLRDEVKNYLNQQGVNVLPTNFYPRECEEYKSRMVLDLKKCEVFIQLLSEIPGKRISDTKNCPMLQYEVALKSHIPILQWRRKDLELSKITHEDYRNFLNNVPIMAVGIEEFKRAIFDKLTFKPPREKKSAYIFVKMDPNDKVLADEVSEYLKKAGLLVMKSRINGKADEIREDLFWHLKNCDALIIIYGNTTLNWVREQIAMQYKVIAQRETPLKTFAVIEGPPEPKESLDIELSNLNILNCSRGFNEDALDSFIASI